MQRDQPFWPQKPLPFPPIEDNFGNGFVPYAPNVSAVGPVYPPCAKNMPLHGVEFGPSEVCPRNFIIFDQTEHRSQIMFHPGIAHKFNSPGFNFHATYNTQENFGGKEPYNNDEREASFPLKEDSDDIDALLSLEGEDEEEDEDYDDDEVSTARTNGNYGCNSPDSCSNYDSKPRKNAKLSGSSCSSSRGDKNRHKMKKMVKALRGIVPGGNRMNTVAVLDEAVRYLKSLKVEVQKLGVGSNLKN